MLPRIRVDPIRYLQGIPEFSGRRGEVTGFVSAVDAIIPMLGGYDEFSLTLALQTIKNRFVGHAKMILEGYPHIQTWTELRRVLDLHFQDDKSSERLIDEMRSQQFKGNIQEFYNLLLSYKRRIMVQAERENQDLRGGATTAEAIDRVAIDVFTDRMPPLIGTILESRNPTTLEEAMRIIKTSRVNLNKYDTFGNSSQYRENNPRPRQNNNGHSQDFSNDRN